MQLPGEVHYPVVAIGDVHGLVDPLRRLLDRLAARPEWPGCAVVWLGDFVDRGSDVPGAIDLVLEALDRAGGGSAVVGNHDLALVRAAGLDDREASPYWIKRYRKYYDHEQTFLGYLGRPARTDPEGWRADLEAIARLMPERHRRFLAGLRWVVESSGHLFLHNGLSVDLEADAEQQVAALHDQDWDRARLRPRPGTPTAERWQDAYPVWIGSDRRLADRPLPHPGRVQVTGHMQVRRPQVNDVRIRIDTSDEGVLTACLLREPNAEPVFLSSHP